MKKVDFIIAGQGIAGSVLALTLLQQGCSVMVLDDPGLSKASRVAAGLYNPVVFKRLSKSWMADTLIPFMDVFYTSAEKSLSSSFYHKKQIVKIFSDDAEAQFWIRKSSAEVGRYISGEVITGWNAGVIKNDHGVAEVKDCGNLDTNTFLSSVKKMLIEKGAFCEHRILYQEIVVAEEHVKYKDWEAKKIIFCEGYRATENPFFSWLPFNLTKGEVITIQLEAPFSIPFEKVVNKGVFILPQGNNRYRVGATYQWSELNENPTEAGKKEILEKLEKVLQVPYTIIEHDAGIRPTVNDRRPLIGLHPSVAGLGVFNGMGTKAVMIAPYFADRFADLLINGVPLDKEADICRFAHLMEI
jgi:glycine/D-amino acid oxidase-like deaminating enzyme